MNNDLISRDALMQEFADRARAARNWKEGATMEGNSEAVIRADATLAFLSEVKLTIEKAPTIESREESHKIDEITRRVKSDIMNGARTIEHGTEDEKYHLLDVIASLHNELHKEMTGAYYDYMYHWANLGYGGEPNDSLYKDISEGNHD